MIKNRDWKRIKHQMRPYTFLILLVLIGGPSLFLFASAESIADTTSDDVKYVVFIDAGSSGCRAHIHSYTMEDGMPKVDASKNMKVKPGLSSYANEPSKAGVGLKELHAFLQSKIDAKLRPKTELHLQATAGLRVLDASVAHAILESVRDELQTWDFKFDRSWARLITGREEGLNGWIAANYLEGIFSKPDVRQEDSYGVVEMGGASLQISYCPDNLDTYTAEQLHKLAPIKLAGKTFHVYTYSYLNYGQEKAEELLLQKTKEHTQLDGNPCFLRGSDYMNPTGDFDQCSASINRNLFSGDNKCDTCSFSGVFQPKHTGEKFFAIENFFYTPEFFEVQNDFSVEKLAEKGRKYCKMDFDTAKTTWPQEDVKKYCFSGAYQTSMLKNGLGFTDSQLHNDITIAHEINGEGIDWALGAVISAITGAMADDPYTNAHISSGSSSSMYFLLFCLVGVGGGGYWYFSKGRKSFSKGRYTALDRLV